MYRSDVEELLLQALTGDQAARTLFDFDGVLCVEFAGSEPDLQVNESLSRRDPYYQHLQAAQPLYVPKVPILGIVTGRLHRYRELTEEWLQQQKVQTLRGLWMHYIWRHNQHLRTIHPAAQLKATVYREQAEATLFVESKYKQAVAIVASSGKPVLCTETYELLTC